MTSLEVVLMFLIFKGLRMGVAGDIQADCPSRCKCNSTTFCVECWWLFSLPKNIPREAKSFHCYNCPIPKITGKDLQNYGNIKEFLLEGSSHLTLDELSRNFLRNVPKLILKGYELDPSDLLSITGPNHTLEFSISLVTPVRNTITSVTSTTSPALGDSNTGPSSPVDDIITATTVKVAETTSFVRYTTIHNVSTQNQNFNTGPPIQTSDHDITLNKTHDTSDNNPQYVWIILIIVGTVTLFIFISLGLYLCISNCICNKSNWKPNNNQIRDHEMSTMLNDNQVFLFDSNIHRCCEYV